MTCRMQYANLVLAWYADSLRFAPKISIYQLQLIAILRTRGNSLGAGEFRQVANTERTLTER